MAILIETGSNDVRNVVQQSGRPQRAVSAEHLGFVAHADLAHLDAGVELRRQLADEVAEVDAAFRREVEDQPRAVERLLDARELHPSPRSRIFSSRDAGRLLLAVLVLQPRDDVLVRGEADDAVGRVRCGTRRSAIAGIDRTTVPSAGPFSVWTTTARPPAAGCRGKRREGRSAPARPGTA